MPKKETVRRGVLVLAMFALVVWALVTVISLRAKFARDACEAQAMQYLPRK